jgi:Mn-dependent DtxR family transcriptional regulator
MTKTELYPLAREAMEALAEHYGPAMQQVRDDAGMQQADWGPVFLLSYVDPRPETAAYLQRLTHYTSLPGLEARLEGAASRGLVEATPDRAYRLTDKGRRMLHDSLEAAWKVMADLEPIGRDEATRLAELLRRVVEDSLAAPEPQDKRHLLASRAVDPGDELPLVARIDQYLTDLALFRDDVHPAAWRAYNVDGAAWEIFTLIWSGEAATLEALTERLKNRAHPPSLIPQALQDLAAREWIARENGGYRATDEGKRLRQEAEDETDRLFYAPWAGLSDAEREELRDLLARLRDGARAAVAQSTA